MSIVAQLMMVGCLTGGIGHDAPANTKTHHAPPPGSCNMTLTVGHVPGRLEPVWELNCATAPESD